MTFSDLKEFLIKFVNRIKPSLESLLVGAILAGLAALGDYVWNLGQQLMSGNGGQPFNAFLTGQTALLVFGGAFINFVTSTIRRIYAKREIERAAVTGEVPPTITQGELK